jgi:hypothetical protein
MVVIQIGNVEWLNPSHYNQIHQIIRMSLLEDYKKSRSKKSPLTLLWNIFSLISGILSLSSLVESIVKWNSYINDVIATYRSIVHPLFYFIFSWCWFKVPTYVYDYLVIGVIIASSHLRALYAADKFQGYSYSILPTDYDGENIFKVVFEILIRLVGWPIVLILYFIRISKGFDESKYRIIYEDYYNKNPREGKSHSEAVDNMIKYEFAKYIEGIKFFQWLGFLIFGIFLLLTISLLKH